MKVLIDQEQINSRVINLGRELANEYEGRPLTIIGILAGSLVLLADLIRAIDVPHQVGLLQASSYRGKSTTPGPLQMNLDYLPDITDRNVLLVDDIFDTGKTMQTVLAQIGERQPRSLKSAVLLWKEEATEVDLTPDYHCFKIPDHFVVGYGLDFNNEYRHLPFIASLEPSDLV
ncbi:MAG: hypoxanthine phosphoribosyltransferase [Planctomycetes bacterium]|nr:hypoxanthine phosphoribosyltransferase [Planctomycetota bacterium]MCH9725709.1 hypoxanthine phosphoribosyltransferase [Planctomycetota bacterium]MCH9777764.1 hypoxanthine phosphoribosyltransferase [Planctomycetota bacterium]MCH9791216.1 hypoxanthine phosphoribosyltransferase [Planctomycetota bacterium]MDF1743722.1 hypoxanthine phosphoribosyltransferase [Gimesia sp.]